MMPTFSHPTGKRAHLMNVYVKKEFRKKGIVKSFGVTEISLDATEAGKPLYESMGFSINSSAMTINL